MRDAACPISTRGGAGRAPRGAARDAELLAERERERGAAARAALREGGEGRRGVADHLQREGRGMSD